MNRYGLVEMALLFARVDKLRYMKNVRKSEEIMIMMTVNGIKLTIDQIRVIRIGLAGFLETLNESRLDGFKNKKMEIEYKLLINEIFKLMDE